MDDRYFYRTNDFIDYNTFIFSNKKALAEQVAYLTLILTSTEPQSLAQAAQPGQTQKCSSQGIILHRNLNLATFFHPWNPMDFSISFQEQ